MDVIDEWAQIRRVNLPFEEGLPLIVIHTPQTDLGLHAHGFSELVIVMNGSGRHTFPEGSYAISAGDVFVLHGDQAHGYLNTRDLQIVNILFRMEELAMPVLDVGGLPGYHALFTLEPVFRQRDSFQGRLRLTEPQLSRITELVDSLTREYQGGNPGRKFASMACFMLVVVSLCRYYARMEDSAAQPLLSLGSVLGYLHQNFAEHLSLTELAKIGSMSRRTLTRDFKRALGCSPIDYLIRLRVNRAMDLLRAGTDSITAVAFKVGFHDGNYFSRQFKAVAGCSPREFRSSRR